MQVPPLQLSESPEQHTQHERERAVIERISAQDIAPKVEAAAAWGPLGSSQSISKFPPLAPSNGELHTSQHRPPHCSMNDRVRVLQP